MPDGVPSARDLALVLARRTARAQGRRDDAPPPPGEARALDAVAAVAHRARARKLDAVEYGGVLLVALALAPDEADSHRPLPSTTRAAGTVRRRLGVQLEVVIDDAVPVPEVSGREPAQAALGRMVEWHLARVAALAPDATLDLHPEGVHRIRATLRSLRCVLRALRRAGGSRVVAAALPVRLLGDLAGAVRDLDVALMLTDEVEAPEPDREAARLHLRRKREPAQARLKAWLDGDPYTTAVEGLARALTTLADEGPLRRIAREQLDHEIHGLRKSLGAKLQRPEDYHHVRRMVRRVRDTVGVLGGALHKPERRLRKRLQPLQAGLGDLHDMDMLRELLADGGSTVGVVREALERRRLSTLAELKAPLVRLAAELDPRG